MIDRLFQHCRGVGPGTEARLSSLGFHTWDDCLNNPGELPFRQRKLELFLKTLAESRDALLLDDIGRLIKLFPVREHWRILFHYFHKATFFDMETSGLSLYYNHPTVIVALHRGELMTFRYGENLEDFIELLDETELVVTFNGSSFDVPFLERAFHVPLDDIPHIDLRWVAYHRGHTGGLKSIEAEFGLARVPEICGIDGYEAVMLFDRWQEGDSTAGENLVRYCRADVIATCITAGLILFGESFRERARSLGGELFKLPEKFNDVPDAFTSTAENKGKYSSRSHRCL